MPLDFPSSPGTGDTYTFNSKSWTWNGYSWVSLGGVVSGPTGPTGATGAVGSTGATGPTGAISGNYVASFNGSTGAVSFVNYVASVNGLTGTLVDFALRTTANTFSVRQVMSAGITTSTLYVTSGATFDGVARFGNTFSVVNASGIASFAPTSGSIDKSATLRITAFDVDSLPWTHDIVADYTSSDNTVQTLPTSSGTLLNTASPNIAKTNQGNTFSVRQVMSAGITTSTLFVSSGATFASLATFSSGITGATATVSAVVTNTLQTPNLGSAVSNLTLNSLNEWEVVPGIAYLGGEINANARNVVAFNVGSGNTYSTKTMTFTNLGTKVGDYIRFVTTAGDIEFAAARGVVINPVTFVNIAEGVLYVDDTNNRVGVNTTVPGTDLEVVGGISASNLFVTSGATFASAPASDGGYRITSNAINSRTGTTYSLLASDNGKVITWNATSGSTLTVPSGLPVGFNTTVISIGTGSIGITGSGVTLNSFESKLRIAGQHAAVSIISYSSNIFNVAGGLTG